MPKDNEQLQGQVTETPSSDAYIARHLATIQSEIEATTGKIIEIPTSDIHTPKIMASQIIAESEKQIEEGASIDPLSRFVTRLFQDRQLKKAA